MSSRAVRAGAGRRRRRGLARRPARCGRAARGAARRLTAVEAAVALARTREDRLDGELRDAQAKLALLEARSRGVAVAAGLDRGAVPRSRAVARRPGAGRGRADPADRQPADRPRRQRPGGARQRCSSRRASSAGSTARRSRRCAGRSRGTWSA
ncbi:MAG: hypothetical protein MZW92_33090 [Comamonadaceae bacterium]|nr:hypothetical protein [Comamonadaceae bacterium]